jgi:protein-S-isoprenylcysteine O-methyltransferase Ste14
VLLEIAWYAPRVVLLFAAIVFPVLFFVTAPYGRHARPGWGPSISARLGWLVMEAPSFFVFGAVWLANPGLGSPVVTVLGLAWLLHYGQRTFVFSWLMRDQGKRNALVTVLLAIVFNVLNASGNAAALGDRRVDAPFVVGLLVFAVGFALNLHADAVLRGLRKPGETGYRVPHGGLYRWVSAPNYLGEIIEWVGFAIAAQTLAGWAFALFTFANLAPRAVANHRWYLRQFPDYPAGRRALIPFVW